VEAQSSCWAAAIAQPAPTTAPWAAKDSLLGAADPTVQRTACWAADPTAQKNACSAADRMVESTVCGSLVCWNGQCAAWLPTALTATARLSVRGAWGSAFSCSHLRFADPSIIPVVLFEKYGIRAWMHRCRTAWPCLAAARTAERESNECGKSACLPAPKQHRTVRPPSSAALCDPHAAPCRAVKTFN